MSKGILLAWIVSIFAVLGSLYFSEVRGFIPCEWCWYQRILMYPLPVLLGIGLFREDHAVKIYALPFAVLGVAASLFHYAQQKIPYFASLASCSDGVPCSGEYINMLGFITIPLLAFAAFSIITAALLLSKK